eukprot:TRINITY_DN12491_c0_g1_i4.p1 TRINITY_DN12491_c0_g1~~TRINITY_DN12491_c0_g1_i4.p1  ORF type:complete len:119 (+),score=1.55 TRINITY_DN12491_c0_g1_i4:38-358(+)
MASTEVIDLTLDSVPEVIDLTGLDDDDLKLPAEPVFKKAKRDSNIADCPICYEQLKLTALAVPTCCGRVMCSTCAQKCSHKQKSRCPFCRKKFKTTLVRGLSAEES